MTKQDDTAEDQSRYVLQSKLQSHCTLRVTCTLRKLELNRQEFLVVNSWKASTVWKTILKIPGIIEMKSDSRFEENQTLIFQHLEV